MAYLDADEVFEKFEVEYNGEYVWRNDLTRYQFHNVVVAMGWASVKDFIRDTGIEYDDIKGQYWQVAGFPSRVFIY